MATEKNIQDFEAIFGTAGNAVLERIKKYSPRVVEHVYEYIASDLYQDPVLDVKTRELCVISSLVSQGGLNEQLVVHVRTALNNGVQKQEIISVIETAGSYAGIPRALNGLFTAIETIEAWEAEQENTPVEA